MHATSSMFAFLFFLVFSLLHCHTFLLPFLFHGGVAAPIKCLFQQVPPCSQIAATLLCSSSINMFYNTQTQDLQLWTFACLLFCNKADYSACDNLQIVNSCSHLPKFPKTSENANKDWEMLFLMSTSSRVFGRILHRGQIPINPCCVYIAWYKLIIRWILCMCCINVLDIYFIFPLFCFSHLLLTK